MLFASPIFLLALLPWVALVLWLLLGKRRRQDVPFLDLWKGPVTGPMARRRIGMPPLALTAALAALLLAIVAAARPGFRSASTTQTPIVVIVDQGITMSAGNPPRFITSALQLAPTIRDQFGPAEVQVVFVPGGNIVKGSTIDWSNVLKTAPQTAVDTRDLLRATVRRQLEQNSTSPVIVVSDQALDLSNERLVQVGPQTSARNISIVHIAARVALLPQVMVRIRNRSDQTRTELIVRSDNRQSPARQVDLPEPGQVRDYFLPIEPSARVIQVEIQASDDFAGDNVAFLVRRGSWPILEPRTPVFAELQRLIEKYSRLRPPTEQSKRVGIVSQDQVGPDAEIILAKPGAPASGEVSIDDHPITKALEKVDWKTLAAAGLSEPTGDGWKPIVRIGGKAAIAAKEAPSRQVWMGLTTQRIANTPEFVLLWSNIFDWVGEGGEEFVARVTSDLGSEWTPTQGQSPKLKPGWWPGIYRRVDGAMLAVNAPDVVASQSTAPDWKPRLAALAKEFRQTSGVRLLSTPLILAALLLVLIAAITWRGGLKKMKETRQMPSGQDTRLTV